MSLNWASEIPDDQYYAGYGAGYQNYDEHIHTGDPRQDMDYERRFQNSGMDFIIPARIREFFTCLHQAIFDNDVALIQKYYNNDFNELSESFFKSEPWPAAHYVAPLVNHDKVFIILYKELYYRHYYAKIQESLDMEVRCNSYDNYCELFNFVLNAEGPVSLELPTQWLWDIIDEFIYQFQSFSMYRNKVYINDKYQEVEMLSNTPKIWNVHSVLNVLHSLIEKSNINRQLEVYSSGTGNPDSVSGEYGKHTLYKMLGYFSLVGLLRLHCLLGDYYQALKVLGNIDFSKKNMYSCVPTCQITTFYYVGFAYLMMRRYQDAIRTFADVLLYIQRTKQLFQSKAQLYDQVSKLNERIYTLMSICLVLHPMRIDESIHSCLRDKYSDKMQKMQRGELEEFKNSYLFGCPKFISPVSPILEAFGPAIGVDPYNQQLMVFMEEVQQQIQLPTIRSYLKLYATLTLDKLAIFLDMNVGKLRTHLQSFKHKMKNIVWNKGTSSLDGEFQSSSEVDFYIDGGMIHVADTKVAQRYGDFFIRQIHKYDEITKKVQHLEM